MGITEESRHLPPVLSLCSGYAGIERGLDLAGVEHRVLAYVEIEAFAIANLVAKMEAGQLDAAPIYTDLKTFPAHLFRGAIDIITGGYPCQPFSAAGKRLGAADPRHLWPFIWGHVDAIAPDRVFFENVDGHASKGLSTVVSDLEGLGYETAWGVFSAAEVGAPHQRKRVYIMGDSQREQAYCRDPRNVEGQTDGRQSGHTAAGAAGSNGAPGPQAMGDAQHTRSHGAAQRGSTQEAGNDPPQGQDETREPSGAGEPGSCSGVCGELADTGRSTGPEGEQSAQPRTAGLGQPPRGPRGETDAPAYAEGQSWPARPGQEQFDWEERRTLRRTEPGVGGAPNGCPDRVDRVRLLGNGVVPQTAAKAWLTLDEELRQ